MCKMWHICFLQVTHIQYFHFGRIDRFLFKMSLDKFRGFSHFRDYSCLKATSKKEKSARSHNKTCNLGMWHWAYLILSGSVIFSWTTWCPLLQWGVSSESATQCSVQSENSNFLSKQLSRNCHCPCEHRNPVSVVLFFYYVTQRSCKPMRRKHEVRLRERGTGLLNAILCHVVKKQHYVTGLF